MPEPIARGPIPPAEPAAVREGWEVSTRTSGAPLTLADLTPLAKVVLTAREDGAVAEAVAVPFGRARRAPGLGLVTGREPGQWLVLAAPGAGGDVARRLEALAADADPEEFATVVDLTHGRALLRLTGADAPRALARVCAVDLAAVPDGALLRCEVAGLGADVVRLDADGIRSYLLHCERSTGRYLSEELLHAGRDFGIDKVGFSGAAGGSVPR